MQIERAVTNITTLGPGMRLGIWVNGCNKRCKGCMSSALWQFKPENECDIEDFFSVYNYQKIDGVTISGGEPFAQKEELAHLVKFFLEKGIRDILVYTGYTIEELQAKNDSDINYVLNNIAVLIDGPYIEEANDGFNNLKGSNNQRIIILNPNYKELYENYKKQERKMQVMQIANIALAVGIPEAGFVKHFLTKEFKNEN